MAEKNVGHVGEFHKSHPLIIYSVVLFLFVTVLVVLTPFISVVLFYPMAVSLHHILGDHGCLPSHFSFLREFCLFTLISCDLLIVFFF